MIYDFSFDEVMRLSAVRRWGIVEMSRQQSVAEHSYNVAMIAGALADMLGFESNKKANIVMWALVHDLPEVVTGDLPTTIKAHMPDAVDMMEKKLFPKYMAKKEKMMVLCDRQYAVVKAADWIDAIQFADKFCVDTRANEIINEMHEKLDKHCIANSDDTLDLLHAVSRIWRS